MPTFGDKFLTNFQASKAQATQRAMQREVNQLRLKQINEQIRSNRAAESDRDAGRELQRDIHQDGLVDGMTPEAAALTDARDRRQTYTDPDTNITAELSPEQILAEGNEARRAGIAEANLNVQQDLAGLAGDKFELTKDQYANQMELNALQRQRFNDYVGLLSERMREPHPVVEAVENAEELNFGETIFDNTIGPLIRMFGYEGVGIGAKKDRNQARLDRAEQELRDQNADVLASGLLARINSQLGLGSIQAQSAAGAAGIGAAAQGLPDVPLRSRGLLNLGPNDAYGDILRQLEQSRYTGIGTFQNQARGQ